VKDGIIIMNNNENYNISFRLFFNENIIIYLLILNGVLILISFLFIYFLSTTLISLICSIIISITFGILINYFILTRSKLLLNNNIEIMNNEINQEIEEYQTIMK
jgi:uncharacterized membrane-anchored protein YitT (DUF2179 family)